MTNHEWALKMLPVLVRWAQGAWDKPHYYSDLSAAVGHKTNQIGNVMGTIQVILTDLGKKHNKRIPTLNALACSKSTDLPSDGFDFVVKNYSKLSKNSQKGEVKKLNLDAHQYDWQWVLDALGLKPAIIFTPKDLEKIKSAHHASGGEGKEHKAIKDYICAHPESVGIKHVTFSEKEHDLFSGDSLDVYFECGKKHHFGIEVKPSTASDADIMRGIFQCVKYKVVMDAERVVYHRNYENDTLLVIAGTMSEKNKQLAIDLSVKYIENFKMK